MASFIGESTFECLKSEEGKKFTAKEIAKWIFYHYPDKCRDKQERSKAKVISLDSDEAVIKQISAEVSAIWKRIQKEYKTVKRIEDSPRLYYYTNLSDEEAVDRAEKEVEDVKFGSPAITEHNLYPLLYKFLASEFDIYSKRIDETKSINSGGRGANEWLHPDIVGMEVLNKDWHKEIGECVKLHADEQSKLWSFEVKKLINLSNVRKSFFQTVSNSSWANFGYLVATEIDDAAMKELRMLASLHGIGFIRLDIEDLSKSQIMIPARERREIDWDGANRLANENKDFVSYIKLIRQFYQTGDVPPQGWDGKSERN